MTEEEVVQALISLIDQCGWRRLEILNDRSGNRRFSGYCVDAEGKRLHISDLTRKDVP